MSTIFPRCHLMGPLFARTIMSTLTSSSGKLGRVFVVSLEEWEKADDTMTGAGSDTVEKTKCFH